MGRPTSSRTSPRSPARAQQTSAGAQSTRDAAAQLAQVAAPLQALDGGEVDRPVRVLAADGHVSLPALS